VFSSLELHMVCFVLSIVFYRQFEQNIGERASEREIIDTVVIQHRNTYIFGAWRSGGAGGWWGGRAIEGLGAKIEHLHGGVDIGMGRDQPLDYPSVPVLSRDEQRGGPNLRSE
jgi:hypothetical protein